MIGGRSQRRRRPILLSFPHIPPTRAIRSGREQGLPGVDGTLSHRRAADRGQRGNKGVASLSDFTVGFSWMRARWRTPRSRLDWTISRSARQHAAGCCFVPDCERVVTPPCSRCSGGIRTSGIDAALPARERVSAQGITTIPGGAARRPATNRAPRPPRVATQACALRAPSRRRSGRRTSRARAPSACNGGSARRARTRRSRRGRVA